MQNLVDETIRLVVPSVYQSGVALNDRQQVIEILRGAMTSMPAACPSISVNT